MSLLKYYNTATSQWEPLVTGSLGYTGSQGIKGDKGDIGEQGLQGTTGTQGPRGFTGEQGVSLVLIGSSATITTSTVGYGQPGQGWINTTDGDVYFWNTVTVSWENIGPIVGPRGDVGCTGPRGAQGEKGNTGTQGISGYTGSQGIAGYDGSRGIDGYSGSTGYVGSQGAAGYDGSRGIDGYSGSTGYVGSQGEVGYVGSQGIAGPVNKYVADIQGGTGVTITYCCSTTATTYTVSIGQDVSIGATVTFTNVVIGHLGSIVFQGCGTSEYYPQQTRPPRYWTQCQVCSACMTAFCNPSPKNYSPGYWTCCYALPGDVYQAGPQLCSQLFVVVQKCNACAPLGYTLCLQSVSPICSGG